MRASWTRIPLLLATLALFAAAPARAGFLSLEECGRLVSEHPAKGIVALHARLVSTSIGGLTEAEIGRAVKEAVALKKSVTGSFPDAEFLAFADENAIREARRTLPETATLEAVLDALHLRFLDVFEPKRLEAQAVLARGLQEVAEIPGEVIRECRGWKCQKARIRQMSATVQRKLGLTCMADNPVALSNFARDLAYSWGGLIIAYSHRKDAKLKDFPFEYMATGLIMGPIVAESSCRKYFVKSDSPGSAPKRASMGARIWNYARWYPVTGVVAVGLTYLADQMRGKKGESGQHYLLRWFYYMLYDALTGPLRKVLIQEPIIFNLLPRLQQFLAGALKNAFARTVLTEAVDWGTRLGISTIKAEMRLAADYGYRKFISWLDSQKTLPAAEELQFVKPPGPALTKEEIVELAKDIDRAETEDPLFQPQAKPGK